MNDLYFYISRLHIVKRLCADRKLRELFDITSAQATLIVRLLDRGDSSVTRLAELGGCDVSVASRLLARLSKKGLVESRTGEHNRRMPYVGLTADGTELAQKVEGYTRAASLELISILDIVERRYLELLLTRLIRNASM